MTNTDYEMELVIEKLRQDKEHIHLLCPSGIGDMAWICSKILPLLPNHSEKFVFWLPALEQHRAHQYLRLWGMKYGFLPELKTQWVWQQEGEHKVLNLELGDVVSIHANGKLEAGIRIEEWVPEIPFCCPSTPELYVSALDVITKPEYVLMFACHNGYMGGNILPIQWANIARIIQSQVAPVRFIGAGEDVEFIDNIRYYLGNGMYSDIVDKPIEVVVSIARRSRGIIGLASGPMILSTYADVPTYTAWPRHLEKMIGTWEHEEAITKGCFIDELYDAAREGDISSFLCNAQAT